MKRNQYPKRIIFSISVHKMASYLEKLNLKLYESETGAENWTEMK